MSRMDINFSYAKNGKNGNHIVAVLLKLEDYVKNVRFMTPYIHCM